MLHIHWAAKKHLAPRTFARMNACRLFQSCISTTRWFIVARAADSKDFSIKFSHISFTNAPFGPSNVQIKAAALRVRPACWKGNIIQKANISGSIPQNANYV